MPVWLDEEFRSWPVPELEELPIPELEELPDPELGELLMPELEELPIPEPDELLVPELPVWLELPDIEEPAGWAERSVPDELEPMEELPWLIPPMPELEEPEG